MVMWILHVRLSGTCRVHGIIDCLSSILVGTIPLDNF